MKPNAALIMIPDLNLKILSPVFQELVGQSLTSNADTRGLKGGAFMLSCLEAFANKHNPVDHLLYFGVLIGAEEYDLLEILGLLTNPSFTTRTVNVRDSRLAIVVGSLTAWRDAIRKGCSADVYYEMRCVFNQIYLAFCQYGMESYLGRISRREHDQTFLLE